MELNVNRPALAGQNIDPDTFQRVWDRVMPGQARENTSVPDTAVPAFPTETQEQPPVTQEPPVSETPPVTETPPAAVELPPVPDCPAMSQVPDCPQETPECPACPECPGTPSTPSVPGTAPTFCLGEASQGDSARLEGLMTLAQAGASSAQAIARRASGACARTLTSLANDHRSAFRRLSAAYFLITGQRYCPQRERTSLPASLPLALRQQFMWEQRWEQANRQGAQSTADPCLKELYLELAQEGAFHAGTIRSLLEQMA